MNLCKEIRKKSVIKINIKRENMETYSLFLRTNIKYKNIICCWEKLQIFKTVLYIKYGN